MREKFISNGEKREQQKEREAGLTLSHTHIEHIYIGGNKGKKQEKKEARGSGSHVNDSRIYI